MPDVVVVRKARSMLLLNGSCLSSNQLAVVCLGGRLALSQVVTGDLNDLKAFRLAMIVEQM